MEQNKESNIAGGLLLGFLAGGIVGATLALLLAPKSGKELRRDIRTQKDRLTEKASEFLRAAQEAGEDAFAAGQESSRELLNTARERANTIMENAERSLADAKSKAGEKLDAVKTAGAKVQSAAKAGMDAFRDELKQS